MSGPDVKLTGVPLLGSFSDSEPDAARVSKKRKRDVTDATEKRTAGKKKGRKQKPEDVDFAALNMKLEVNSTIAHMDSRLMADHIAQKTKRFRPELSLVEAENFHVSERAIVDTTSFDQTRTSEHLPGFLERFAGQRRDKKGKKLSEAPGAMGSPHTLVITAAGLRAADLTRALRKFQTKDSMVAKLFAKHIKLKDAVEMVKKSRMGIGVGTPQRIGDLIDSGALKLDHLERIVVDASHIDQKKRGILDMKETQTPLAQLLTRGELKGRYVTDADKIELLFF